MQVPAELEKLLPVAEARPLEVAVAAPGDADNMVQALMASGASVSGEDGARAVLTALVAAKRARPRPAHVPGALQTTLPHPLSNLDRSLRLFAVSCFCVFSVPMREETFF